MPLVVEIVGLSESVDKEGVDCAWKHKLSNYRGLVLHQDRVLADHKVKRSVIVNVEDLLLIPF